MRLTAATAVMALVAAPVVGAAPAAPADPTNPPAADARAEGGELERFVDGVVAGHLEKYKIPGAAVVVIAGGRQVLAKGYGMADVDKRRPVDADTPFYIASTAKLITATAVMKLVERGQLDLHADVNTYLSAFKIKDTFPGRPVTLHHLLTHTAGFEDKAFGLGAARLEDIQPAGRYLANQPRRVREPGRLASYSNYGMALAGYLVQVRSGKPFATFMDEEVLRPLGMTSTSFAQPPPEPIATKLARNYSPTGPARVLYDNEAPAGGGTVSTVGDMGRFMLAHTGTGTGVLSADSTRRMQTTQFRADPGLPGVAYGFVEDTRNGQRLLTHSGGLIGLRCLLTLLPDRGEGLYVVYNGDGTDGAASYAASELVDRWMDHFHPAINQDRPTRVNTDASRFAGSYASLRTNHSDITSIFNLIAGGVTVDAASDGTLTTSGLSANPDKPRQQWIPIGPRLFTETNGEARIAFSADGRTLYSSANPTEAYAKPAWYARAGLHRLLFAAALILLFAAVFAWPVLLLIRRLRRRPAPKHRWALITAWLTAVLIATVAVALLRIVSNTYAFIETIILGGSAALTTVRTLGTFALIATGATLVGAALAWRHQWWKTPARIWYTAIALAATIAVALLVTYHVPALPSA